MNDIEEGRHGKEQQRLKFSKLVILICNFSLKWIKPIAHTIGKVVKNYINYLSLEPQAGYQEKPTVSSVWQRRHWQLYVWPGRVAAIKIEKRVAFQATRVGQDSCRVNSVYNNVEIIFNKWNICSRLIIQRNISWMYFFKLSVDNKAIVS